MTRTFVVLGLLAGLAAPVTVLAGPFRDFESDLRDAYGQYRVALFQSNQGDAQATTAAIETLSAKWTALETAWGKTPPPQYADDPDYAKTLAAVETVISQASQQLAGGDLGKVHVTLEGLRAEVAGLHDRNGIVSFSDRMNAYHARMEMVLGRDLAAAPDGGLAVLGEDAAVLSYLVADITAHPAPESADPAYAPALEALTKSVQALQDAVRAGDAAAARKAVGGLKGPYSKLFAKFG